MTEAAAVKEVEHPGSVTGEISRSLFLSAAVYRANPAAPELIEEVVKVDALNFKFRSPHDSGNLAQAIAGNLQILPAEEVMSGAEIVSEISPELLQSHADLLEPGNLTIRLVGKEFAKFCDQREEWYGTEFGVKPLDLEIVTLAKRILSLSPAEAAKEAAAAGIALPMRNPFIPENLEIVTPQVENSSNLYKSPELVASNQGLRVFHLPDDFFGLPKAAVSLALYSHVLSRSCVEAVAMDVLTQAVTEELNETVGYQAQIAGLKFSMRATAESVTLQISGFNDKQAELMKEICGNLRKLEISRSTMDRVMERVLRSLRNQQKMKKPYEQASDLISRATASPYFSVEEKLKAALVIKSDLEIVTRIAEEVFNSPVSVEALIGGNVTADNAISLATKFCDILRLNLKDQEIGVAGTLDLRSAPDLEIVTRQGSNEAETNGAAVVVVQAGFLADFVEKSNDEELRLGAQMMLLSQICGQQFFDELRTKQQLGYIVNAHNSIQGCASILNFFVQSEVPAFQVSEKIEKFISELSAKILEISSCDFQRYVEATKTNLTEKPKNFSDRFNRVWGEISSRRFDFQRRVRLAPIVGSITQEEISRFAEERINKGRRLTALIHGANDTGRNFQVQTDAELKVVRDKSKWVSTNRAPF